MPEESLDLGRIFRALREAQARFVLIGGMAVVAHGSTRLTEDVDVAIAFDRENLNRIVEALRPLNPRPMRLANGAQWVWDEKCVRPPWSIFRTDAGRLDIVLRLPGVDSFDGLYQRADRFDIEGEEVRVASIEDLIAMKSSSDRSKDLEDVRQLRVIERFRREGAE